ncbi:hypothetical protein [Haemophilus sp.]
MSEQFKHKIVAYHTCEFRGESKNDLLKKLPIISSDNRNHNQWLTQGAYFWTDSITHAKKWKVSRYKTRVISEFEIEFNKCDDIFDLVGNVKHIEFLFEIARAIIGQGIDAYASPMTISVILEYLKSRHMGTPIFPFIAVKAGDFPKLSYEEYIFSDKDKTPIVFKPMLRQQLCIFDMNSVKFEIKKLFKVDNRGKCHEI